MPNLLNLPAFTSGLPGKLSFQKAGLQPRKTQTLSPPPAHQHQTSPLQALLRPQRVALRGAPTPAHAHASLSAFRVAR